MLASQLCTYKAIMTLFGISSGTYGDLLCSLEHVLTLFWIALKSFSTTRTNINTCGLCLGVHLPDSRRVLTTAIPQLLKALLSPVPRDLSGRKWLCILGETMATCYKAKQLQTDHLCPEDPHCLAQHTKWFMVISIQSCSISFCLVPLSSGLHNDLKIDH